MTFLQQAYLAYNAKYFKNRLPRNCILRWSSRLTHAMGRQAWFRRLDADFDIPVIEISSRYRASKRTTLLTLLHEMVHLALPAKGAPHGPHFQKEMLRLARAGAFKGLW